MSRLKRTWARLIAPFRARGLDNELSEEIASHIDLATEDYLKRGLPLAEARRRALIRLGGAESAKELHRDTRGLPSLHDITNDIRYALRGFRRDGAFTATAIAMLAIGIGLNVTVFAVMNTMLFRGFPLVKRNDRLLYMQERYPGQACCLSYLDFEDWRAQSKAFQGMAFGAGRFISFSDGGRTIETFASGVSTNTFRLLGVQPMLGRDFVPSDETPGAPVVAMLGYRYWETQFGKRADIVGHVIRIDKAPATVVGVMPKGFDFPQQQNLWLPLLHTPELHRRGPGGYMAFGRLVDGVSAKQARAELTGINRRLAAEFPATNRDVVPRVDTHAQFFMGPDATVVYGSLWAAAWFVLLIVCANLANLTLARTTGRAAELSTRLALGAGRGRMLRQLLIESLLLAGAGAALGWWIAKWSVHAWAVATESPYQVLDYTLDAGTVAYLGAVLLASATLFSAIPLAKVWRLDINNTLKGDARGVTQGRKGRHLSAALVTTQMALAIVLLAGAGVLVRSFVKVVTAEVGLRSPEKVLVGRVMLPPDKYASAESRNQFFDELKARLTAIPGVESVSIANTLPVNNPGWTPFDLEAQKEEPQRPTVTTIGSGTNYFQTVGASVTRGRDFTDADHPGAPAVAIVNQSFADKYWPGEQVLGKRIRFAPGNKPREWRTVVGVVSNIMQNDPTRQKFLPVVYTPLRQRPGNGATFYVRTKVPTDQVAAAVRAEVKKLEPDSTLEDYANLKDSFGFRADRMDIEHVEMGKHAAVAPIFAVIALLLAAIGLYAVIAHSITQRTKEIGIRIALGAAAHDIGRMVFAQGMLPVGVGLAVGLVGSLGVNRVLRSQLVGVSPDDPLTLAAATLVLILVALLGCHIPARRAIRVDPIVALRHD